MSAATSRLSTRALAAVALLTVAQGNSLAQPDCAASPFADVPARVSALACDTEAEVCLSNLVDPVRLRVDGTAVELSACASDPLTAYSLADLFAAGDAGPWEVIWRVAPTAYRGRVGDATALLEFFQLSEGRGGWAVDAETGRIVGAGSPHHGTLTLTSADTRLTALVAPVLLADVTAQSLPLPPGRHTLTYEAAGCSYAHEFTVDCADDELQTLTASIGDAGEFCLPVANAADATLEVTSGDWAAIATIVSLDGACVRYEATQIGSARIGVRLCDAGDVCTDYTLALTVDAGATGGLPLLTDDVVAVAYNGQDLFTPLRNDLLPGELTELTLIGSSLGTARIDARNRLHYTSPPDWCGEETLGYRVCNPEGCSEASIRVQVLCDTLVAFSGMSPNGDGNNDAFTVLGIENFPNNSVTVFDQKGVPVYRTSDYANDWEGTYEGTPLQDGTYYYVVEVTGREPISGYLQLIR